MKLKIAMLTLTLFLTRLTVDAEPYPVIKVSNLYCFDATTAAKIARELLDYQQVTNLVSLQAQVISNDSNVIAWQSMRMTNMIADKKRVRRQAIIDHFKTGFWTGTLGTTIGIVGALLMVILL